MAYWDWSQHLPSNPTPEFLSFIEGSLPLSKKLRDKWLYQLAQNKDWGRFLLYYKESPDISLQCYALLAQFHTGQPVETLQKGLPLWLQGQSQPIPCNALFTILLQHHLITDSLITQRIRLALERGNIPMARYLLNQYPVPHREEVMSLNAIYQDPTRITKLPSGALQGDMYVYGLKRLVSINMKKALRLWADPLTKTLLNEGQRQAFIAHVALYKAMRDEKDAATWFNQIKPQYNTVSSLDWQIRFALKNQQWSQVERLINLHPNKADIMWQYWLARALAAQGQSEQAKLLYTKVAEQRHYYGFLASLRLKTPLHFLNEPVNYNLSSLQASIPLLHTVRILYHSKQILQASRMLNDFVLELPKEENSALMYWLDTHLHWYGKSVYLSNLDPITNQLSLRFPMPYQETVDNSAKTFQVSPELIYAIIRQESGFRDDVVSPAGAQGLMQLLPSTAQHIAKRDKIPFLDKKQLFNPQQNIVIGTAYLRELTKQFHGHALLMIAAYNAGPRQVRYWLKNHQPKAIDIWIETLPWQETRNYLKNVIAFYAVYQFRMHHPTDLSAFLRPLHAS